MKTHDCQNLSIMKKPFTSVSFYSFEKACFLILFSSGSANVWLFLKPHLQHNSDYVAFSFKAEYNDKTEGK